MVLTPKWDFIPETAQWDFIPESSEKLITTDRLLWPTDCEMGLNTRSSKKLIIKSTKIKHRIISTRLALRLGYAWDQN